MDDSSTPESKSYLLLTYLLGEGQLMEGFVVYEKQNWQDLKRMCESLGAKVWDLNIPLATKRELVELSTVPRYDGAGVDRFGRPSSFFNMIDEKVITEEQAGLLTVLFSNGRLGPVNIGLTVNRYIQKLTKALAEKGESCA